MAVCVLDTETNGVPGQPLASVIELGAVVLTDSGEEISAFNTFVKPMHPLGKWSYYAMQANGIDARILDFAPEAPAVWDAFLSWLSIHKPLTVVYAFNVPFDKAMMAKTFPDSAYLPWGPCLMRESSHVINGERRSIKLLVACEAAGVDFDESAAHRALYDARVTGQVYRWLRTYCPA